MGFHLNQMPSPCGLEQPVLFLSFRPERDCNTGCAKLQVFEP